MLFEIGIEEIKRRRGKSWAKKKLLQLVGVRQVDSRVESGDANPKLSCQKNF